MDSGSIQILIAMIIYIAVVIGIGVYFAKRANESSDNFLIGGRKMGPWVVAMGAGFGYERLAADGLAGRPIFWA